MLTQEEKTQWPELGWVSFDHLLSEARRAQFLAWLGVMASDPNSMGPELTGLAAALDRPSIGVLGKFQGLPAGAGAAP